MPLTFSVNLPCMMPGGAPDAFFAALAALGYRNVECWRLTDKQAQALLPSLRAHGMVLTAMCADDFRMNEEQGRAAWLAGVQSAARRARMLGCGALITQAGADTGAPRARQHEAIVSAARAALPILDGEGVTLLIEPLNTVKDHPGTYLTDSDEGALIVREADSPRVRMLYDVYHQLHMGEDVLDRVTRHHEIIGHYHIAGFPKRDERLFEGFSFQPLFERLASLNTRAPIGIELNPSSPERGLELLERLKRFMECGAGVSSI